MRDRAVASYEVVQCDDDATETASIAVTIAFISNTAQNLPGLGVAKVRVVSAGLSRNGWLFRDVSADCNAFAVNATQRSLLFPFVTSQMGLDTRLVISNTSRDSLGTVPQMGPVSLVFFGKSESGIGVPSVESLPVPAGEQLLFTLSQGGNFGIPPVRGFQGYLVARAGFEYCHGIASVFEADGNIRHQYKATRLKKYV
jgi:hypothetical protein